MANKKSFKVETKFGTLIFESISLAARVTGFPRQTISDYFNGKNSALTDARFALHSAGEYKKVIDSLHTSAKKEIEDLKDAIKVANKTADHAVEEYVELGKIFRISVALNAVAALVTISAVTALLFS